MSSIFQLAIHPIDNDGFDTPTSEEQVKTESALRELLALYTPQPGKPASSAALRVEDLSLNRKAHIAWLKGILNPLPPPYTTLDASRPWLIYWVVHSLALLGASLDEPIKERAVETIKSFWNESEGGFGGGPAQMAHLAPTYASVSALCYLGGPENAWDWIDRQAIHDWMLTLKQSDGSFVMHKGGEVDARGCYCAVTTAVLLNILTPDLASGTSDFVISCQTYEGGIASASQPWTSGDNSSGPLGEAHGGYTFCAFASYFSLQASPSLHLAQPKILPNGSPKVASESLNARSLLRWASHMQGFPNEIGGFRGRTNKLVDGCYSWWCGGLFAMLSALLPAGPAETGWPDERPDLFNRTALQEYVLIAAQAPHGGLRDKPGKGADAYHSCYNLAGLSAAQHAMYYNEPEQRERLQVDWLDQRRKNGGVKGISETVAQANIRMRDTFVAALAWQEADARKILVGAKGNEVAMAHPVFNLEMSAIERMLRWSYSQPASGSIVEEVR